jgi:hypothetical protein
MSDSKDEEKFNETLKHKPKPKKAPASKEPRRKRQGSKASDED